MPNDFVMARSGGSTVDDSWSDHFKWGDPGGYNSVSLSTRFLRPPDTNESQDRDQLLEMWNKIAGTELK